MKVFPRHTVAFSKEAFRIFLRNLAYGEAMKKENFLKKFEKAFAEYLGVKYAFGVASGRAALAIILDTFGFKAGTEIIISDYNFPPIPLMLKQYGLRPVFVDIDPEFHNLNVSLIEKKITPQTGAILVTHLFGQSAKLDAILEIAKKNKIKVIEDCAHACGAQYQGKKVGSFGDASYFSFGPGKSLPCFGGGSIVTGNETIARKIRDLCDKLPEPPLSKVGKSILEASLYYLITNKKVFPYTLFPAIYLFSLFNPDLIDGLQEERIGSVTAIFDKKYRMTILQAMVGLSGLKSLDEKNQKRIINACFLNDELKSVNEVEIVKNISAAESIYLYYRILVNERDKIRRKLLARGIDTEKDDMRSCSTLPVFENDRQECPVARRVYSRSLQVPCNPSLAKEDLVYISRQIKDVLTKG